MSFSEESLKKKFHDLTNTQQSVQTLSLWLIHHRKHAKTIVTIWLKEIISEKKSDRKLTFMYLANDILQNSRKKGLEYQHEFTKNILLEAIQSTALVADSKLRFSLERILNIWKDRKIFQDSSIEVFKSALHNPDKVVIENLDDNILRSPPPAAVVQKKKSPYKKPAVVISSDDDEDSSGSISKKKRIEGSASNTPTKSVTFLSTETTEKDILDLKTPEALEIVKLLLDLEQSASSDAVVRGQIAELPPQVSDLKAVGKLKDQFEVIDFTRKVNDSILLVDEYNQRLNDELIQRKRTAFLLAAFIKQQKKELDSDKLTLAEWKLKVKQVDNVKSELRTHLHSLPDLKILDEEAELSPLPTFKDLFQS